MFSLMPIQYLNIALGSQSPTYISSFFKKQKSQHLKEVWKRGWGMKEGLKAGSPYKKKEKKEKEKEKEKENLYFY